MKCICPAIGVTTARGYTKMENCMSHNISLEDKKLSSKHDDFVKNDDRIIQVNAVFLPETSVSGRLIEKARYSVIYQKRVVT